MLLNKVYTEMADKMDKTIEKTKEEFTSIRTGRASTSLLNEIKVEYYGTLVPVNQVASVIVPEAKLLEIKPWDKSVLAAIEKAILKSNLGLTPVNDGKIIRLTIPTLTEERRKELVKIIHKLAEDSKIILRNIRRHTNETIEKMEKDKQISEDDKFKAQEHIQKVTDDYIKKIDELTAHKQKEIMEV